MATSVRELELDLDAFEGPFDLLLTLILRDQLQPADVDMAAIVVAFVSHLADRDELDLDACGEFLVLIAALLEIKARHLFPEEEAELSELEPEEAAEELARRLAEYRRMKEAAAWLRERMAEQRDTFFRLGPAPLAPKPERRLADQDMALLAEALRGLAVEPPKVSLSHMALRFPPSRSSSSALVAPATSPRRRLRHRGRAALPGRAGRGISRSARAAEGRGGASLAGPAVRADPRLPVASAGAPAERNRSTTSTHPKKDADVDRSLRLISTTLADNPIDQLARTIEALLVVASQPLSLGELWRRQRTPRIASRPRSACCGSDTARDAVASCSRTFPVVTRSGPRVRRRKRAAGCSSARSSAGSRKLRSRRWQSSRTSGRSRVPRSHGSAGSRPTPTVASLVERGLIAEAGRESAPGGAVRYRVTRLFERVFGLESLAALPRLDDLGGEQEAIKERLLAVAEARAS